MEGREVSQIMRLEGLEDPRQVNHVRPTFSGLDFILCSSISKPVLPTLVPREFTKYSLNVLSGYEGLEMPGTPEIGPCHPY